MNIQARTANVASFLQVENERSVIPSYQRRYSWEPVHVEELLHDVDLIEGGDRHLLGSIVCLMGPHTGGVNDLELVDGQQRITTIMIVLWCIAERLKTLDPNYNTSSIDSLLFAFEYGQPRKPKLALESLDADEFNAHVSREVITNAKNSRLAAAFSTVRQWAAPKTVAEINAFLAKLKNASIMIRLEVSEAKDAFRLFETINNRGLSLSPTDIIKNFLLGNASTFGQPSLDTAKKKWADLIQHLDSTSLDAFFRHYLCAKLKRRITVSFVIENFKSVFMAQVLEAESLSHRQIGSKTSTASDDPATPVAAGKDTIVAKPALPRIPFAGFLEELVASAKAYGEIVRCKTSNATTNRHLDNLRRINALQTFGFLMALRLGGCDEKTFIEVLRLTEAFLIRRHICRQRANENESLFARLCSVDARDPLPEITHEYRKLTPSDDAFRSAFATETFTSNLIERARYCLEQFEYHAIGGQVELSVSGPASVHVEHIIPQKIKSKKSVATHGDWVTYLGEGSAESHAGFVGRIGNLTLLSGTLNNSASNGPYAKKRVIYAQSSLSTTKKIATDFTEFRFEDVADRSSALADTAILIWPTP